MRVASVCLLVACILAPASLARSARAGDDAGLGGAGGAPAGAGGEPQVQPTTTPDNFGCHAAGPRSGGMGVAGLLLLCAAVGARARRRRS